MALINSFPSGSSGGGGPTFSYIVGSTPYASDWLSLTNNGPALTPNPKLVYLILTPGDYYHNFVRWDSTNTVYVPVVSAASGAVFSYIDSTKTALDADWLLKAPNGDTISPKAGPLYLILTQGDYYNSFYRFDENTDKYVLIQRGDLGGVVFATIDSAKTALDSDWLKNSDNVTINPMEGNLYLITSPGSYENNLFKFDATTDKYVLSSKPGYVIQNEDVAVPFRVNLNLIDFDFSDDSTADQTTVKTHELTDAEIWEILNPLPQDTTPLPEEHAVYAFQIDGSNQNPATAVTPYESEWGCLNKDFMPAHMNFSTNTFDYGSWTGNEFFFPKPCVLNYDGTVAYYLDKNDYTKKIDGTAATIDSSCPGNVMIEFPTVYFKRWQVNSTSYCVISNKALTKDFKAYAHTDVNGDILPHIYIAAYDGSYIGGKLRSVSGISANTATSTTANRICTYTTRQQEVAYAQANNVRTDCEGWSTWHKADRDMVNDLLILLGMNLNTQATFGRGRDSGGSSASSTGMVSTGSMNNKGLFWGENAGAAGVKVFGIENWWGNFWKSVQGLINANGTLKVKMTYDQSDNSTVYGYNFDGSGYRVISGATPAGTSGGHISGWKYQREGLVPYQVSGTDSTYLCDGMWFNNAQNNYGLFGGGSGSGLRCGAFFVGVDILASFTSWNVGAALSFKGLV